MISYFFSNKSDVLNESCYNNSIDSTYVLNPIPSDLILGKDVMNDLEVFQPYDNQTQEATLIHKINQAQTIGGKQFIIDLIKNPIFNKDILEKRIECMKNINQNKKLTFDKQHEDDFMWLHSINEETITELLNSIYFQNFFTRKLNQSETVLTSYNIYRIIISPVLGVVSPIIYFLIPYFILKFKFGNKLQLPFTTYIKLIIKSINSSRDFMKLFGNNGTLNRLQTLTYVFSLVFYFQGILNSSDIAITSYKIIHYISDKINNAMLFLQSCLSFVQENTNILEQYAPVYVDNFSPISEAMLDIVKNYKSYKNFTIFSHFGKQLKLYKHLVKQDTLPIVNQCYLLDALYSLNQCKENLHLSYPTFISYNDNESIRFVSKDSWNIHLPFHEAIKNDIDLGNTIITGPNAGGKSTTIKMIATNVLLAQTIGLTSSSETIMTPFFFINTQINIPDCKGQESLFEAEMNRCLYNLNTITENNDKPALIIMDEIFNSTNVVEAISGAYAILEKMATYTNAISIITTHLTYLTKLKKTSSFDCYCMSVTMNEDGEFTYPYYLKQGVSKQYIALELLKNRGFPLDVIENALKIKEHFVVKRV